MDGTWDRREILRMAGGALLGGVLGGGARADEPPPAKGKGRVVGQPLIRHAREGFEVIPNFASATKGARAQLLKDAGSARLLLNKGEPLQQGGTFRNPDLADLLTALAEANSVEPFYRGDVARRIAA